MTAVPVVFYALPGCSGCRQAGEWLSRAEVPVVHRHIRRAPPTRAELADLASRLPGGASDLLSRRSVRYRELGLAGREPEGEPLLDLLAREPHLLRRPIVSDGRHTVVGFDRAGLATLRVQ